MSQYVNQSFQDAPLLIPNSAWEKIGFKLFGKHSDATYQHVSTTQILKCPHSLAWDCEIARLKKMKVKIPDVVDSNAYSVIGTLMHEYIFPALIEFVLGSDYFYLDLNHVKSHEHHDLLLETMKEYKNIVVFEYSIKHHLILHDLDFSGLIDCLIIRNGKPYKIIDFKTSKKTPARMTKKYLKQVHTYAQLFAMEFPEYMRVDEFEIWVWDWLLYATCRWEPDIEQMCEFVYSLKTREINWIATEITQTLRSVVKVKTEFGCEMKHNILDKQNCFFCKHVQNCIYNPLSFARPSNLMRDSRPVKNNYLNWSNIHLIRHGKYPKFPQEILEKTLIYKYIKENQVGKTATPRKTTQQKIRW